VIGAGRRDLAGTLASQATKMAGATLRSFATTTAVGYAHLLNLPVDDLPRLVRTFCRLVRRSLDSPYLPARPSCAYLRAFHFHYYTLFFTTAFVPRLALDGRKHGDKRRPYGV